jgi:hypothetical protein
MESLWEAILWHIENGGVPNPNKEEFEKRRRSYRTDFEALVKSINPNPGMEFLVNYARSHILHFMGEDRASDEVLTSILRSSNDSEMSEDEVRSPLPVAGRTANRQLVQHEIEAGNVFEVTPIPG